MKNSEPIIEQTNLSYQLLEIKNKLNWVISDAERYKLTQKARLKASRLKEVQKEVQNLIINIL